MNEWSLIRLAWLQPLRRQASRSTPGERARSLVMGLGFAAFLGVLYEIFKPITAFFWGQELLGPLLLRKGVYLVFSVLFGMLILSSLISGASRLFGARDEEAFLSSPLSQDAYFRFRFWQACLASSWMFLPLWMPLLFALRKAGGLSYGFVAWGLVAPLALAPLASALAFAFLMEAAGRLSVKRLRGIFLAAGALSAVGLVLMLRLLQPESLTKPESVQTAAEFLRAWSGNEPWWNPATYAAKAVMSAHESPLEALQSFAMLTGLAAGVLGLVFMRYGRRFRAAWLMAGSVGAGASGSKIPSRWLFLAKRRSGAMLFKELAALLRHPVQRLQLLILAALVLIFVYNLQRLPFKDNEDFRIYLFLPACGFAQLILVAVAARFVFPSESLESRWQWLLRGAPLSPAAYLSRRMALALIPLYLLGAFLLASCLKSFEPPRPHVWAALTLFFFTPLGVAAQAAFLGLAWKREDATEPEEMTTSTSGVLLMAVNFIYVMAEIGILSVLLWEFRRQGLELWKGPNTALIVSAGILWLALQAAAVLWPARQALRAMRAGA